MIPAFPLLGRDWSSLAPRSLKTRFAILASIPILATSLFVLQARTGIAPIDPLKDPTSDLEGWEAVASELRRRGVLDRPGEVLFTGKWFLSGHVAFAINNVTPVACFSWKGGHNFDYWENSSKWIGRDATLLVINENATEPAVFRRYYERIEPDGEFTVERGGRPIRRVRLFRCLRQLSRMPTEAEALANSPGDGRVR